MSQQKEERRCPECGDADHLYARADIHWDRTSEIWRIGNMEDAVDCTECDWTGSMADTLYTESSDG
jgi:hypothetical protein